MFDARVATRFLVGFSLVLTASCEPAEETPPPPAPTGGFGNAGGSSGNASGGNSGSAQGGDGGMSAGTGGTGGASACAEDCPAGGFCMAGECKCPSDKTDVCDATCVSLQASPEHCGTCSMACDPGAACSMGVCGEAPAELAKGTGCGAMRLALVGTDLYWTEADSGAVKTMPVTGGTPADVATGQLKPLSIAADADGVYWANEGDESAGSSTVMKKALPLAAGAPVTLVTGTAADPESPVIKAIAVADSTLYYTLVNDVRAISTDEAVTDDVVVGTATNLDIGMASGYPSGLAVDGTYVVWTTGIRSAIERDDLLEGSDAYLELGESQGDVLWHNVASDGTNAYWATTTNIVTSALVKEAGGANTTLATTPDFKPITAFAIDAANVYFANDGSIFKAPLGGGDPVIIARDQAAPSSMLVEGTTLYFATSDCAVRTLPLE